MAYQPTYLNVPSYVVGRSNGSKAAIVKETKSILKSRLALITLDLDKLDFSNLGQADWPTIINDNPSYAPLFNAVKNGLLTLWLGDVERGENKLFTSADWLAENWNDLGFYEAGYPNGSSSGNGGVYAFWMIYTLVERKNPAGENILSPSVVVLLNDDVVGKWANRHVTSIKPYTKPYANYGEVGAAYVVETELGHSFIVNELSHDLLLGDPI